MRRKNAVRARAEEIVRETIIYIIAEDEVQRVAVPLLYLR